MRDPTRRALAGYGGAIGAIVLATLLRRWLDPFLEESGFVIYFGAVVVVAWLGGLGPSLLALLLSLAAAAWFFAKPPGSAPDHPARVVLGLGFYFFVGVLTAVLSESMRGAKRRAESLAAEALRQRTALSEADRRKDEFLAILAHELRNPLSPICAALDILRLPGADARTTRWAQEVIERQDRHLVRLVDDLLDTSRITSGKIELRVEKSDLREVVTRAIETARPLIDEKRHDFDVTLPSSPVILLVDPVRLAQVIGNLLTNAAKYTEPGGRIWLSVESSHDAIELRVRDTGTGIAPEMLPRIFDLFAQDPRSAGASPGGLGIGLCLVKALVELSGGKVEARSDGPGTGTEFIVHLPLQTPDAGAPAVACDAVPIESPPPWISACRGWTAWKPPGACASCPAANPCCSWPSPDGDRKLTVLAPPRLASTTTWSSPSCSRNFENCLSRESCAPQRQCCRAAEVDCGLVIRPWSFVICRVPSAPIPLPLAEFGFSAILKHHARHRSFDPSDRFQRSEPLARTGRMRARRTPSHARRGPRRAFLA
ncbi:MAG TPA: ATP-binding protein [Pirellulales bacterium]|jgi:signal transduction histidine kinase|nr:ATP-binding protein [Pirellulales bacterium]